MFVVFIVTKKQKNINRIKENRVKKKCSLTPVRYILFYFHETRTDGLIDRGMDERSIYGELLLISKQSVHFASRVKMALIVQISTILIFFLLQHCFLSFSDSSKLFTTF